MDKGRHISSKYSISKYNIEWMWRKRVDVAGTKTTQRKMILYNINELKCALSPQCVIEAISVREGVVWKVYGKHGICLCIPYTTDPPYSPKVTSYRNKLNGNQHLIPFTWTKPYANRIWRRWAEKGSTNNKWAWVKEDIGARINWRKENENYS